MSKTQDLHDLSALVPVQHGGLATREPEDFILEHPFTIRDFERAAYPLRRAYEYAVRCQDTFAAHHALVRLSELVDDDRAAWTLEVAYRDGLWHVEYKGKLPVPDQPITVTCPDHTRWTVEPVFIERKEPLWVPREAMEILQREAEAGLSFDTALVLHELPAYEEPPAFQAPVRNRPSRWERFLQVLDPGLVGVLRSHPDSEIGHHFILCRWAE